MMNNILITYIHTYDHTGDKTRFESHLQHEHEAYFGLDVLLAVSFMRDEEQRTIVKCMSTGEVY